MRLPGVCPGAADMSQLHWKDSYLVIELGRLYLGRARVIRVTMAPGPIGRELHAVTPTLQVPPAASRYSQSQSQSQRWRECQ